jgi:putative acetyltransferase
MQATPDQAVTDQTESATEITIRPLQLGEDATAFRTLNEEWITRYFTLEPKDIDTLNNPRKILANGGHIYFARLAEQVVGCVALLPLEDGIYELSKMAVSPAVRGRGIGRTLLEYTIAQAQALGAKRLFLGSNSVLANAVHLYESLGFRHIPKESLPWIAYARADVFMDMTL